MSRFSDRGPSSAGGAIGVVVVIALMAGAAARAAVEPESSPADAPALSRVDGPTVRPGRADASVVTARKGERRLPGVRCWQDGRLVYEGPGLVPAARGAAAVEFRAAGGPVVQVFDLRSGLCLAELPEGP